MIMRWCLVLIAIGGLAAADPRKSDLARKPVSYSSKDVSDAIARGDADRLAGMVFATALADRERVLDALVKLGRIDKRARASVPATATLANQLRGLLAASAPAGRAIGAPACTLMSATATGVVLDCRNRGCASGCSVIYASATVTLQSGKWSIKGPGVQRLGDTGECGCCMQLE
jgi:hypothetical protein